MLFRNLSNGNEVNVSNLSMKDGRVFFSVRGSGCGTKFFNKWRGILELDEHVENGTYLRICDGWELTKQPRQRKQREQPSEPVPQPVPTPQPMPTPTPKADEELPIPTPTPSSSNGNVDEAAIAIAEALKGLRLQAVVDIEQVKQIATDVVTEALANIPTGGERVVKIQINNAEPRELPNGAEPHPLLKTVLPMVVNDRVIGRYPWLYGPAGSGKSTLAKQVADAMGLPFYSVSSLQQKYELEGYTDAVGKLVETTFYKAFKDGGIFCFDEASTTAAEVQVAFNTACAQLIYNFPKEGMIEAHPDFHIIAADNSMGRGGDKRYSARYKLDVSTLDRYTFVEVDYTNEQDLRMANGDEELLTFVKDVRKAIDAANLEYLASPRASKAIKALQATGMSDKDAVWYGLCSGWNKQDIRTINARLSGYNKYYDAFSSIARSL